MRINIDRLSQLAGLPVSNSKEILNESSNSFLNEEEEVDVPASMLGEDEELPGEENEGYDTDTADEAVIEVDEAMLVQELRRVRKLMNESRRRKSNAARKQTLYEAELKAVINQEVQKIMKELNLSDGWVYGKNKPTRSRLGGVHQGTFLKGPGFK